MITENHVFDICVVGGGIAGMCAAISAARHGCRVALIHDRPVFGGNSSSEMRVPMSCAQGNNRRETGVVEELLLENMRANPMKVYPIWDSVLYGMICKEKNIQTFMNCSVFDATTAEDTIISIKGWQLTTYKTHVVHASIFIDCSGDSILARLSGAEYRTGREAELEFHEAAAPETADSVVLGSSMMINARQTKTPAKFIPMDWSKKLEESDFKQHYVHSFKSPLINFWWIELGGDQNTLDDCEKIGKELTELAYGVWDHVKNGGDHMAENWELDWVGHIPAKRESARCIGDYILRQDDVISAARFEDMIAYGCWSISTNNHPPKGFYQEQDEPVKRFVGSGPFGIPYRCIYSVNIKNLMFAGRNISATHCAMYAARITGTCAVLGQAAGTAAAIACKNGVTPREIPVKELQQSLMQDDCWLPGLKRTISANCMQAELTGCCDNIENLRNGIDRPTEQDGDNGCYVPLGTDCVYTLKEPAYIRNVRIIFDSDLNRETVSGGIKALADSPNIPNRLLDMEPFGFPTTMTDSFDIFADDQLIHSVTGNRKRHIILPIDRKVSKIALRPQKTCGDKASHIFAFDFE